MTHLIEHIATTSRQWFIKYSLMEFWKAFNVEQKRIEAVLPFLFFLNHFRTV